MSKQFHILSAPDAIPVRVARKAKVSHKTRQETREGWNCQFASELFCVLSGCWMSLLSAAILSSPTVIKQGSHSKGDDVTLLSSQSEVAV